MTSDEPVDQPPEDSGGLGLGTLPLRFAITYTFIYMLPFPLSALGVVDAIPGVENSFVSRAIQSLVGLHERLTAPMVAVIGRTLTGQDISMEITGSSDTLACYCDFLLDVVLALVVTLIWWAWRRSQPVSPQVIEVNRVLVRYLLFVVLVSYGVVKVFPGGQFGPVTPTRLLSTYGDSSPMGLLWTFMGASTAYSMFGGLLEVVGGMLLLFRRTTLLGSLVVAGVMANVFALNLCYDVPVKLFSFHLLALALFLTVPDMGRLYALFVANKAVPRRDQGPPWELSPRARSGLLALKYVYDDGCGWG
ncbi:MAG: hypothetical protein KC910_35275 [Candidatus Eremiobacteraeota bacterium]|nr:hypothetical protein [Candidatus Eremiobacteraeota bacterium]